MIRLAFLILLAPLLSGCWIYTNIQGNGTVTSPATGNFNCSTGQVGDCQQEYESAGAETLQATADPGHTFAKWAGCAYDSLETCITSWTQGLADNAGAVTVTATFKEQNPPVQAAQYTYNALGQRITKTVNLQTTIFQYDLDGNLMAEIDAVTGQSVRQHIHVNGEPLAQLSTNLASGRIAVQYVHADHLGTPTLLTNQFGQVVVDIEATPFGETYIDYAEVTHNRRFPGQYRDEETGLHYNYFRDYDPSLGRYIQSDPIGLAGGLNTYAYVGSNPMMYTDPEGLFKVHGNWCGPDHTGGFSKSWGQLDSTERSVALEPIDNLDRCCQKHDKRYAKCRERYPCDNDPDSRQRTQCMKNADRRLSHCASASYSSKSWHERSAAKGVGRYMSGSSPSGR